MRGVLLALTIALTACAGTVERRPLDARAQEADRLMKEADAAFDHGDAARARALMEQAAATGHPEALNGYAVYVARGIGGEPDPKRAEELVERAAAAGSIGAKLNLALQRIDSEDRSDQRRAVAVLADLHANPPDDEGKDSVRMVAAGGLAKAYLFGIAVEKDVEHGVDLLEEADASAEAQPEVLFWLGHAFESGWGGRTPDSVKSYLYFMRAAQLGHAPSQWKVGMALLNESGAQRDEREAYRWVRMSAEAGYVNGQISTAVMLARGQGVDENDVEARTWYERAANKSSAHALRGLGFMLLTGEGGPRDPARGLAYVQLAADAGDQEAMRGLASSRSQLSDDERALAEKIAAQWLREHGKPIPD